MCMWPSLRKISSLHSKQLLHYPSLSTSRKGISIRPNRCWCSRNVGQCHLHSLQETYTQGEKPTHQRRQVLLLQETWAHGMQISLSAQTEIPSQVSTKMSTQASHDAHYRRRRGWWLKKKTEKKENTESLTSNKWWWASAWMKLKKFEPSATWRIFKDSPISSGYREKDSCRK